MRAISFAITLIIIAGLSIVAADVVTADDSAAELARYGDAVARFFGLGNSCR